MTHSKGSEDRLSEANVLSSFELSDMPWLCLPFVGSIFVVSKGFAALENIGEVVNSELFP